MNEENFSQEKGRHQLTFAEWETKEIAEGRLDKENDEILIIPNHLYFENNKLVVEGYSKLKALSANSCALEEIEINCSHSTLKVLSLNDNKLENIDPILTKLINLRTLIISNNQLTKLKVNHLRNLEDLSCPNNFLRSLNVSNLDKLEDLNCSDNKFGKDKDGKLKKFKKLFLKGCSSLKRIDADLNDLSDLDFSDLTSLEHLSVRQNSMETFVDENGKQIHIKPNHSKVLILNSPFLKTLDYKSSDVKEVIYQTPPNKPNELRLIDNVNDEGYCSDNEDAPTEWEQSAYEGQKAKLKKDFKEGNHVYQGQQHLDLSGCYFINSIKIDGNIDYPKSLVSINLGDNYLEEVIIRNLPNLKRLIISHNKVKKLVIENCPKLEYTYDYKSGDGGRTPPPDAREYDEQKDNPFKQQEKPKNPEKERMRQFIKDLLVLIEDIEKDANEGKWDSVKEKITKIKGYVLTYSDWIDKEIQERINRLEARLFTSQAVQSRSKNKMIIGFASVAFLTLGILALLANKLVKKIRRDG